MNQKHTCLTKTITEREAQHLNMSEYRFGTTKGGVTDDRILFFVYVNIKKKGKKATVHSQKKV